MKTYLILLLTLFTLRALAHEGEDHGEKKTTDGPGKTYFTVYTTSEAFELVLRYDPITKGKKTRMKLFVSDFETNQAIDSATLAITTLEDEQLRFVVQRVEPGLYTVEGLFPADSTYTLVVNLSAGGKADLVTLEGIEVGKTLSLPETARLASGFSLPSALWMGLCFLGGGLAMFLLMRQRGVSRGVVSALLLLGLAFPLPLPGPVAAHEGEPHDEPGGKTQAPASRTDEVETPKETQFLFAIQTTLATRSDYGHMLRLSGKVLPVTGGEARIIAPQSSSLISLGVGIGQAVKKGQLLAVVRQNLTASEQIALATEKSNAEAEWQSAKKEYERLTAIADIAARKDVEQAAIRFRNATAQRKLYQRLWAGGDAGSQPTRLVSPIDGVVASIAASVGQQVGAGELVMNVYNNRTLRIDAQLFASDAGKLTEDIRFSVEPLAPGLPSREARLVSRGTVVNTATQSTSLVLEMENPAGSFQPGEFVNVNVLARLPEKQLVVPTSALSDIAGQPVVFVHTSPETFRVRYVQLGESNSAQTIVLRGLAEKERVVVQGTYQVKSIYTNQ